MIYEIKPPYVPLSQHQYCCVPTTLQMIFYRRSILLMLQEDIGYELGLIVSEKDKQMFNRVRTGARPLSGYGTQVHKPEFSINMFFKKYKIHLHETIYGVKDIKNIKEFIIKNIKNDNDLVVCFNYKKLYGKGSDGGHVSLLSSFDSEKEVITLIDPENNVPKYREVKLSKLVDAMDYHGKNKSGGFWIISKTD